MPCDSPTPPASDSRRRPPAWAIVALALVAADGPSDPAFTALKVDGKTFTGRLRALGPRDGATLALDDGGGVETIPAKSLVRLTRDGVRSPPPSLGDGGLLLFPDGDRLVVGDVAAANEATLAVRSPSLGADLAVPLDGILGLILAPPSDPDSAWALAVKVRSEPRDSEILRLANGDRLAGAFLGLTEKKVTFGPAAGRVELDRAAVVAIGFDPRLVNYPRPDGPFDELTFADGSRLGVSEARVEGGQVVATTRLGLSIRLPLAELAAVHVRGAGVDYLSDREPTIEKSVGYIGPTRKARRGLAADGGPIRLGGRTYDHGIGVRSKSYLAYRLDPGASRFQATVGLDDRAGPLGSVVFRVIVDGEEKYASPPMSARDVPRALDLGLSGAQTLILVTDFGERGDVRDHADWAEARLIR